ncbi:MAG: class I SAM-dependent methyltransferase [Bacteroidales bacterium]|nr:class I SAM-dependent methyltransferase [Bacteroidales bacterium]
MEKKIITNFVHPDIEDYAEKHTSPENEVLTKLNRWTHLRMTRPRMLSGAYQGKLLEMISYMMKPSKILEIGAYVGYSAVCLAKGLENDGILHTIEADEELEDIILKTINDANLDNKIKLHIGEALNVLPSIDEEFDLVFIDADKINYINYYEQVLPKVRTGGIIILDNILWSGKVVYTQPKLDKETATLIQLNDLIQNDPRVENLLLPIRDGLMICRKI